MQAYNDTDQLLHQLSQTIAKFNRTLVPEAEDDSHTNLAFDLLSSRLIGRWATIAGGEYLLGLNLSPLAYQLINKKQQVIAAFPFFEQTQKQVEQKLAAVLSEKWSISERDLLADLHYDMPTYKWAKDPIEDVDHIAIADWVSIRQQANVACDTLLRHLQVEGEVRIWPHHFDTGIYVKANEQLGVGFGLAMQDGLLDKPYYYMSGYGLNRHKINFSNKPTLSAGKAINTDHFKGIVLPLDQASNSSINKFVDTGLKWLLNSC